MAKTKSSKGAQTRVKELQFKKIIEADLDQHLKRYPNEIYLCIEMYGGKPQYEEDIHGPAFDGSSVTFCKEANIREIDYSYIAFETNLNRAEELANVLDPIRCGVFTKCNSAGVDMIDYPKETKGLIIADANGMFNLDTLMKYHKKFPNLSMLLNFNYNSLKRIKGNKKIRKEIQDKYPHPLEYITKLPKWDRYLTEPKDKWQWIVAYLNKDGIDPAAVNSMVPFNSDKGVEYIQRAALTKNQVKLGHTLLSPFFVEFNLIENLGLIA